MSEITIQCANCQASNPLDQAYCDQCDTPLIKRYLWSVGDWIKVYQIGELIDERYLLIYPRILLDTKPGIPPNVPEELPQVIQPYLKLFPYAIHIPQIYSYFPSPDDQMKLEIWLLEYGSLPLTETGELQYGEQLLPNLTDCWSEGSPLRQLHWLWQIAKLWQPLASKGVVSSLLDPNMLKVNGYVVQILELHKDPIQVPTLKQLGKVWSQWLEETDPNILDFVKSVCEGLEKGKIKKSDQLMQILDQGLKQCGQFYQHSYQIFTATDTGPVRDHNEDACYPVSDQRIEADEAQEALTLVCDGIGGQEGGEIASKLAIDTLVEQLSKIILTASNQKETNYFQALDQAIKETNNRISQRNDQENRKERQRMGTTLVMGVSALHEMYLAHVGDSRIYWITPDSCHQVTTDDDLASREVRLGYLIHRDAIQYPNSGALIQALGMSNGSALHPNVQKWIIDQDCIFLLCSDGLSDYDRVDQYWKSEIVPLLQGEKEIEAVGNRLIELSNQKNGHDNVTVGLIYCQVKIPESFVALSAVEIGELSSPPTNADNFNTPELSETDQPSQLTALPTVRPTELSSNNENPGPESEKSSSALNLSPMKALLITGLFLVIVLIGWILVHLFRPTESPPLIIKTPQPTSPDN
ncbi:MAG: protein phosphatase 2C domain-containing protein [Microcystaceae cyanobacterium]